MKKLLINIINYLENSPVSFNGWIVSFGTIVLTRLYVENLILGFPYRGFNYLILFLIHTAVFFILLFLVLLWFLKKITQEDYKKIIAFLLWGFWLIILPPILDKIIFGDRVIWSYYLFDGFLGLVKSFIYFFGENVYNGITLGTRVMALISIFSLAFYVWIKTKKIRHFFFALLGVYFIFFIFSSFPSLITLGISFFSETKFFEVSNLDVAKTFLTPFDYFNLELAPELFLVFRISLFFNLLLFFLFFIFYFFNYKEKFIALIKNIRYPQTIFNSGLLIIGLGMGWFYFPKTSFDIFSFLIILNLLIMVFSAWFYSVFINDLTDQKIDSYTNKNRPLIKKIFNKNEYFSLSKVFLFFSLITALMVGFKIFNMLLVYHLLTWCYSQYPFRIKKYYPFSALLSSFASLIFLLIGFMVFSPHQTLESFPWRIFAFLFIAFFLVLPAKDFKDIEGDKKDNVYTLPVIFGEKMARNIMAVSLFFLYLISIIILKERQLFFGALFFGSASFWLMFYEKISRRQIVCYLLGLVFLYWLLVIKIIFA